MPQTFNPLDDGIHATIKNYQVNNNKNIKTIYIHTKTFKLGNSTAHCTDRLVNEAIDKVEDADLKVLLKDIVCVPKFGQMFYL